ncbi:ion transporter [Henriciella mobilis]|uniref:Ion transporter n=1 Tax=Henriciella mobilis TaxID=2305467 RepID=A0A399RSJ3_9PROT|nr:ion transporter [Henriciella mobilis]RIJ32465.1 ion transporter [Henriciella mobilis]
MARATLDETTSNSPLEAAIESRWFLNLITGLIILNAAILGILTYADSLPPTSVYWLEVMDRGITYAFAFEILLKLFVYRFMFFRSGWNWFDFIVVGISMVPGGQGFSVLRAMRVLRVLRLLHVVPMMRRITEALLKALPGMGAIVAVLALLTYVYAVMATNMYGDTSNEEVLELFGDLPSSAYSLFQVMTMDGWRFEVVQKVVDDGHPWAPLFFLTFIFVASFAVLNLFIALIVDALAAEQKAATEELLEDIEEDAEHAEEERDEIFDLLRSLKDEIAELKSVVSQQSQQR